MKIISGSINGESNQFLHAGYLSGSPTSFARGGSYRIARSDIEVIDVKAALRLEDSENDAKPVVSIVHPGNTSSLLEQLKSGVYNPDIFVFLIVAVFFFYLTTLYYRRIKTKSSLNRSLAVMALPVVLVLLGVCITWSGPGAEMRGIPIPRWREVPVREYADPGLATKAILYGIIGEGMSGCYYGIENLAHIQSEIGFPIERREYTPGMVYALNTFGLDGWRNEFRFGRDGNKYRVSSAGSDGVHDTHDDIIITTLFKGGRGWMHRVGGVYLRDVGDQSCIFLHRIGDHKFEFANKAKARKATGTDLYDMIPLVRPGQRGHENSGDHDFKERVAREIKHSGIPLETKPLLLARLTEKTDDS